MKGSGDGFTLWLTLTVVAFAVSSVVAEGVHAQTPPRFSMELEAGPVWQTVNDVDSTKDDLGFVPPLHLAGRYRLDERWFVSLDLDAPAGGPGRAEDLSLKLGWQVRPKWAWEVGDRTVEGGADVDEVYSFAWLHYAVTSVRVEF